MNKIVLRSTIGQQWNKEGKQKTKRQIELEAIPCPMKGIFTVMKQSYTMLDSLISKTSNVYY